MTPISSSQPHMRRTYEVRLDYEGLQVGAVHTTHIRKSGHRPAVEAGARGRSKVESTWEFRVGGMWYC